MDGLDRETIIAALERLSGLLDVEGKHAQMFLVGGAVMCLVFDARDSTKDIDAWFSDPQSVRTAARRIAEEMGLPDNWLNDAAKGFVPQNAGYETWRSFPALTVSTVDARTLLAMKCAAARTIEDRDDISFLAKHLGLHSAQDVIDVVLEYYPVERLPVRAQLLLEEIFDDGE